MHYVNKNDYFGDGFILHREIARYHAIINLYKGDS